MSTSPRGRTATALLSAAPAVLLALAACSPQQGTAPPTPQPPPTPALAPYYQQTLDWKRCGDDQCARMRVPVDYGAPEAGELELALRRAPAEGTKKGSLVLDPGGPGAPGTQYAAVAQYVVTPQVLDAYDIVGFDPRGVGDSAPVDCLPDDRLDAFIDADATPDDSAELDAIVAFGHELAQGCTAPVPGLMDHLSTLDAARDLDVLRAVLGEDRLDYLGVSYGTHLGATYAALFPDKVGRMVLDGPLPSALSADEIALGQAAGFEDALRRFVADCLQREDCPLGRSEHDPTSGDIDSGLSALTTMISTLDARPVPTADPSRPLTEGAAWFAVLLGMYSPDTDWTLLRSALRDLDGGDGAALRTFLDERVRRNADGTYADNSSEAFYAVTCVDRPVTGGIAAAQQLAKRATAVAPTVGPYIGWGNVTCDGWPHPPVPPRLPSGPLPPILVVATTHDPATPAAWGPILVRQLGDSAVLLTRDGDGHTGYREGSACTDSAIDAYLLDGVMPAEGTICR